MECKIEIEGKEPIVIKDRYAGASYSGGRAPTALYQSVGAVVSALVNNPYEAVRIKSIDCQTVIRPGRLAAEIESVELDSDAYAPGDTLKATAFVRPYKGEPRRLTVTLKLPADMPEGTYTATVCDDVARARMDMRDKPDLNSPLTIDQVIAAIRHQTAAKRTNLAVRVPLPAVGVNLGGESLPDLPPGLVQVIGQTRRTGAVPVAGSVSARKPTEWVLVGSEAAKFTVTKNKKSTRGE
jgi:hypothetical protein